MKLVESISLHKKTLELASSMFSISPTIAENICQVYSLSLLHFCYIIMMFLKKQEIKKVPVLDVVQVGITTKLPLSLIHVIQTHGKGNKESTHCYSLTFK